jgi:tetratricopeptide (TPR) repeat protein
MADGAGVAVSADHERTHSGRPVSDAADWSRVKEILHEALARAPEERGAFLRETCGADDNLQAEVESLLAAHVQAGSFAERPAIQALNEVPSLADDSFAGESVMHDGDRLGAYQIQSWLGAGGMGEVYRARDTKLGRDVAIKVLPAAFSADPDRLRRFEQEARAAAALNHPNIVTIHSVEEANGIRFLTMELVEGRPLSELIPRDGMPLDRLLNIAIPLASALSIAHSKGITHRDLKPANIMVGAEGVVKILDFGLAKLRDVAPSGLEITGLPTELSTSEGRIVGTVAYMSPEQAEGRAIDARSDLFSLGVILYELATGKRPFRGDTNLSVLSSIVNDTPTSVTDLNPRLPLELGRIINHCLVKDREHRYQTAKDLRNELEELKQAIEPGKIRPVAGVLKTMGAGRRWWRVVGAVAIVAAVALAAGAFLWVRTRPQENRVTASGESTPRGHVRRSVAVLGFKNLSGRSEAAWLSVALSEMLTTELAAGEKLRTIPGENVARTKIDLSLSDADSYAQDTLSRIRKNLNTDYVVLGSYFEGGKESGGRVRLDLRLQDAVAGETIASMSEVGTQEQLLDLVSRTGAELREKLGVGQMTAAQASAVRASLPSSPEAARLYSEGLGKLRVFDAMGARDLLEKAVAADPNHAPAHSALAATWSALMYDERAKEEAKKAFELSGNLTREERRWVEGRYRETTNDWEKAIEVYRTLFEFFPDNLDYGLRLANAQISASRGKEALATVEALRKLPPPERDDPQIDIAEAKAARPLSDFRRAQAAAAKAAAKGQAQGANLVVAVARMLEGSAFEHVGEPTKARAAYEQAQGIYAAAGDRAGVARALNNTANLLDDQGDSAGARERYEQALAVFREVGNKVGAATLLNNIAGVLLSQGDFEGAKKRYEQALAIWREVGNKFAVGQLLNNIATLLLNQGNLAEAKNMHEEALAIRRETSDKSGMAYSQNNLGEVRAKQGDLAGARKSIEQALAIRKQLGEKRNVAQSELSLASVFIEEGRPAEAEILAGKAAEEFRSERATDAEAQARTVLAESFLPRNQPGKAQEAVSRAKELAGKGQDARVRFSVAIISARVRAALGEPAEAMTSLKATLAEATKYGFVGYQFEARFALGEIEMESGKSAAGQARLEALEKDAKAKGFGLIARKAASALAAHRSG